VSPFIFLHSGPLGLLTHPQRSVEVITVTQWLSRCLLNGSQIIVPAIVYYELKRELLRARKTLSVGRLDALINAAPGRYLPLSDDALRLAAELWAQSRQAGRPTAESKALDIDVLIAAQALSFGVSPAEVVVATTNPRHLGQCLLARTYSDVPLCRAATTSAARTPPCSRDGSEVERQWG
jgi:predicted nucleic acid-binding protein